MACSLACLVLIVSLIGKAIASRFSFVQKIPVRELRASDKTDIVELAVVMQAGKCPFIVEFFGCLIRDVSKLVEG